MTIGAGAGVGAGAGAGVLELAPELVPALQRLAPILSGAGCSATGVCACVARRAAYPQLVHPAKPVLYGRS